MKKFLVCLLAVCMFAFGAFAFTACDEESGETNTGGTTTVEVYAPDGAPALALAQLMSEEMQFGEDVNYNVVAADTIQTYVTGTNPRADICILPVNLAAKLLGTGESYQMLGTVTHGNIYILSTTETELTEENAATLLAGTKIGCLQRDNFVGYVLRAVLNKYNVAHEDRENKQEENTTGTTAYLYNVSGGEILPNADYDYMIAAEPAVSRKVNATSLKVVGSLQTLYGGTEGYPQAVLVAKTSLIEAEPAFIESFTQAVAANAEWLLDADTQASVICDAVESHLPEGATPSFTESDLTKEVIFACAVRFTAAADCKDEVLSFLSVLSAAAGQTFTASDAFFYTPAE